MVLLLDNFDSFTFNLVDYLHQLNQEVMVVRNDVSLSEINTLTFDSILLSPGPCRPTESGVMNEVISAFHMEKPILGICLGHQAIGEFFGLTLSEALRPVHGKTSDIFHEDHRIFEEVSNPFSAMRYHSLVLDQSENKVLKTIANTSENEIMAIAHHELPIIGLQFHPESILTYEGMQILKNWFRIIDDSQSKKNHNF